MHLIKQIHFIFLFLFQVHSYVQLERFLSKCFVGHLVQESFDSLAQPTKNSSVNKGHRKHLSVPALQQAFSAHTLAPPLQKSPISEDPDEPSQVTTISVDVSSGDKEFSSTATPDSGIDDGKHFHFLYNTTLI